MSPRSTLAAAVTAAVLSSGCASISNVQRADTLGEGNWEVGLEPGAWGGTGVGANAVTMVPHLDAAVRFGVTERVDLGVRAGMSLLELQGKVLFTTPGDAALAVSLAPTVGGFLIPGSGTGALTALTVGVPVLVGFKQANGNELVLGPRLQSTLVLGASPAAVGVSAGGSVGYLLQLWESAALMPELSLVAPVSRSANPTVPDSLTATSGPVFQVKLGVLLGRNRHSPARSSRKTGPAFPAPASTSAAPAP